MKIKIISCYFGKIPEYISAWLLSCETNPTIDFLLVTDDKSIVGKTPSNVEVLHMTLNDLKNRFSMCTNFDVVLDKAYKICDYKPIFGLAFQDKLRAYDVWGHCDIDLVFGNLNHFIKFTELEQYDRIGKYGHLTLYKNNENINKLYTSDEAPFNWKMVFASNYSYGFDEMAGMNVVCNQVRQIKWIRDLEIMNFDPYLQRIGRKSLPEIFVWENGIMNCYYIEDNNLICKEVAYAHFSGKRIPLIENLNSKFMITAKGFINIKEEITKEFVEANTEFKSLKDDKKQKNREIIRRIKKISSYSLREKIIWFKKRRIIYGR